MEKTFSRKDLRIYFGWSWKAWSCAFMGLDKKLLKYLFSSSGKVLEIGTGKLSQTGLIFKKSTKIELGIYSGNPQKNKIKDLLHNKYKNDKKVFITECDFNDLRGKFEIIIMKSILGGIYKENKSTINDVKIGIEKIINENLVPGGLLISLDNGYGFLHEFTKNYGARKNHWRFFRPKSLHNKYIINQSCFGYFSSFSFQTRIPFIGEFLDSITFFLDKLLISIPNIKKLQNSIIVSVYKSNS